MLKLLSVTVMVLLLNQALAKKWPKGKCEACKFFVETFNEGLKNTENSNFAGGDTSWEEKNQPIYANSEVRLIEVLEFVCGGNDYECTRFLDNNEEDIERWWLKLRQNGHEDFEKWLCFTHLKVCCPEGTYGPDCKDCPGGSSSPCSEHGKCQGSGEVDGLGVCKCDSGYKGNLCDTCEQGYYGEESGSCRACDQSCKRDCSGPGPQSCDECAEGYVREEFDQGEGEEEEEKGECEDIDECEEEIAKCKDGTYCYNTPGSYECKECDSSCKGSCTGRGPSGCLECAKGYKDISGYCMDVNECTDGLSDCKDGTYCDNAQGSFECKECDSSCLMTCTKGGPSGCDVCREGYTMKEGSCEDLDECSSYPLPCDDDSEFCSNNQGSYTCKCRSGFTRVEGKCVSWQKADEIRSKNSEKRNKKKRKKSGKKQPVVEEQDPTNINNNDPHKASETASRVQNDTENKKTDFELPEPPTEENMVEESSSEPVYQTPPTDQPMHQEL